LAAAVKRRRIVVTGLGVVSPCGQNPQQVWDAVVNGRATGGPVTRFDSREMPCHLAAEIKDFQPELWMEKKRAHRLDRAVRYCLAAGRQAFDDSGLQAGKVNGDRMAIFEGTTVTGLENTLSQHTDFVAEGIKSVQPTSLVSAFCGAGSSELATDLGITGQATTICTGCSAGNDAIGYGMRTIWEDMADVVLAGAAEAPIVDGFYSIFAKLKVMSRWSGEPSKAMKPFDIGRDGFVLGEGSAFLMLEELSHALARGARIYCEVLAHGQACDAYHMVALHPGGRGTIQAIERALLAGRLSGRTIDWINAHGSATPANDVIEAAAIRSAFGRAADGIAVSATKPVTGHMVGATAAIEALICALAIQKGCIPPTANLERPDPECNIDLVRGSARECPVRNVMNLNAGFGGKASALIFGRFAG
jgi:3-oxoacyl-[acyl-carrier-protein] synthase II